jgi:NADH-quinone oxidoreductase subunit J
MNCLFYISAVAAVIATVLAVSRPNPVHGLLYLVLSLFSVALVFLSLGAAFAAALEVIVYAGAIMVLFVFVILLINPGAEATDHEKKWLTPGMWIGPSILAAVLIIELLYVFAVGGSHLTSIKEVTPKDVGISLFGPYVLGVELASMLLLAGLVGAYHLGRKSPSDEGDKY